ncbi:MAG: (Fe-S)-binding protein [Candidatus Helarchaeota archaeon]
MTEDTKFKNIKKYEDAILSCSGIGDCREAYRPSVGLFGVCPVYDVVEGNFEPYTARGKLRILQGILEGTLEPTQELAEVWFTCSTCGACKNVCHNSCTPGIEWFISKFIDHTAIWEAFRRDLVDLGFKIPRHSEILGSCEANYNPYFEEHSKRIDWIPKDKQVSKSGEINIFMGCTEPYREPEILQDLLVILDAANVKYGIMHPDEWCCGSIAFRTGDFKLAEKLAQHNVDAFKNAGVKKIITHCSGCFRTLKKDYSEVIEGFDLEVLHVTEFLKEILENGKLKLTKELPIKIAYHDPCHLGRHMGLYDEPRYILNQILGLELIEFSRTRENAWCCGAGGGVKSGFPELAVDIAKERIREAKELGLNKIVTACPFCIKNLRDAVDALGEQEFQVLDILELVKKSL